MDTSSKSGLLSLACCSSINMLCLHLSKTAAKRKAVVQICIQEVPGCNFCRDTGYPDCGFSR